jgi:hypothetical protein
MPLEPGQARPSRRSPGRMTRAMLLFGVGALIGCSGSSDGTAGSLDAPGGAASPSPAEPAAYGAEVERDVERVREATTRFRSLDEAVEAGYPRRISHCLANQPIGAMGYHHVHPDLLDDRIEIERPEILVYELMSDGDYELVGVEYAVPLDAWHEPDPPTVMGQELKPAPELGIWYLHVWVWRENPNGLFADWNPNVACRG